MKLTVTHAELQGLLRLLHEAGVVYVLLSATGPGWIVEAQAPGVDLSAYRTLP